MKRIFISSTCFVLVLILCFFETTILKSQVDPLIILISKASIASNNQDYISSEQYMKQAVDDWEKSLNILGVILRHNELDDINGMFARGYSYAVSNNNAALQIELYELTYLLNHLVEKEQLSIKNVF